MTLTRTSSTNSLRSTQSSKTSHDSLMIGVTRDKEDTKPAAKNTNIPHLVSMEAIVSLPVSTQTVQNHSLDDILFQTSQTLYNHGKSFKEQNQNATEEDANKAFDMWHDSLQAYQMGKKLAEETPNANEEQINEAFNKWYAAKQAYDIGKQFTEQNPNVTEAQKQDHEELTIQFLKQKYLADHKKSYSI